MSTVIPKRFKERYEGLADNDSDFFECLSKHLPKSFRINTIKAERKNVMENFDAYGIGYEKVKWYPDAFTTNYFGIGNTLDHFMGHIYIQELTSMLPAFVASPLLSEGGLVLDCCAAPGSKTTQIAAFMGNRGCIVANDISYMRTKPLKFNIEKMGVLNTIITNHDFRFFSFRGKFDTVFLDAPCTSEGTARKDPDVFSLWSEKKVLGMSRLQKQLILKAFSLVRDGGRLIYSTCTFAPEENEEVVQHLLENAKGSEIEKIKIDGFKMSDGIDSWSKKTFDPEIKNTSRIWPHHNNTDGFFIAKISKKQL